MVRVEENKDQMTNLASVFKVNGFDNFVRNNPKSDLFQVKGFHHVEFWCSDATNAARRFSWALGMAMVAKSDLTTGNHTHASYLLRSGDFNLLFTAPYSTSIARNKTHTASIPTFDHSTITSFICTHGFAVRAIAIEVEDAESAYYTSVAHGAKPSSQPVKLDKNVVLAEVQLYGDVILRYISYNNNNTGLSFLPGFEKVIENMSYPMDLGIQRLDHAVGCVPDVEKGVSYVKGFTGFHEFAEFSQEDLGTVESGLTSVVIASNNEKVLLPIIEPVYGTKMKSQIQTFLEHNDGPGVQHLALLCENIFSTLREMRKRSGVGGFDFMPKPPPTYYKNLKNRIGDSLTDEQIKECEELGIMVDKDDQGIVFQIFCRPAGDRPTFFVEIIQRIGCMVRDEDGKEYQQGGCGGFGKGNVAELFKSVQEYEKSFST